MSPIVRMCSGLWHPRYLAVFTLYGTVLVTVLFAKADEATPVQSELKVIFSKDAVPAARMAVLAQFWQGASPDSSCLLPHVGALSELIRDETEPLELRGSAVHALGAIIHQIDSQEAELAIVSVMQSAECHIDIRQTAALDVASVPFHHVSVDIDDIIDVIIDERQSQESLCEAIESSAAVTVAHPRETRELIRRMLLIACDSSQPDAVRKSALQVIVLSVELFSRNEERVLTVSVSRYLRNTWSTPTLSDDMRIMCYLLHAAVLSVSPHTTANAVLTDDDHSLISALVSHVVDQSAPESSRSEVLRVLREARRPLDDRQVVEIASVLFQDGSTSLHSEILELLAEGKSASSAALPLLEKYLTSTALSKIMRESGLKTIDAIDNSCRH